MPSGAVHTRGGALMASSDIFDVVLIGRGGHASAPHRALDPVPVAASVVLALQDRCSRVLLFIEYSGFRFRRFCIMLYVQQATILAPLIAQLVLRNHDTQPFQR